MTQAMDMYAMELDKGKEMSPMEAQWNFYYEADDGVTMEPLYQRRSELSTVICSKVCLKLGLVIDDICHLAHAC